MPKPKVQIERPTGLRRARVQKIDRNAPDLETVFEDDGDPLEAVEYEPGDIQTNADLEMSEIVAQIKAEKKAQYERFRTARDPNYYLVVCFQSHEQRDEFVQKAGWATVYDTFVNGLDVARALGLDVEPIPLEPLPRRGKPHLYTSKEVL